MNFNRAVIILRAVSGSGKSTFAEYLNSLSNSKAIICTADDFFIGSDGVYRFDLSKLGQAHLECKKKFEDALQKDFELVICANTNTKGQDVNFYIDKAKEYGYTVFSLVVENRHNNNNIHNVPVETLSRQEQDLRNSLKFR